MELMDLNHYSVLAGALPLSYKNDLNVIFHSLFYHFKLNSINSVILARERTDCIH